jgi:hypothetical protein
LKYNNISIFTSYGFTNPFYYLQQCSNRTVIFNFYTTSKEPWRKNVSRKQQPDKGRSLSCWYLRVMIALSISGIRQALGRNPCTEGSYAPKVGNYKTRKSEMRFSNILMFKVQNTPKTKVLRKIYLFLDVVNTYISI